MASNYVTRTLLAAFADRCALPQANAAVVIKNLQVGVSQYPSGYRCGPASVQLADGHDGGERGYAQAVYQLEVRDPKGTVVWDTKRVDDSASLGIKYAGGRLKAATRYGWTVSVWTQAGAKLTAGSWFETGLMDPAPDSSAWGDARWIGGGNEDAVLRLTWRSSM